MYAAARIALDDVIDASRNVHPKAVEAWLAESGQPFPRLSAEDLIRLDDAGVSAGVIDLVVAVSFPQKFALNRQDAYDEPTQALYPRTVWASRYYDPFYYGYRSYYGNRYGYGGYYGGYGGYSGWGGGGYYRPVVVDVTRTQNQGGGRVVAGRGYRGPRSTASGPSRSSGGAWTSGGSSSRGGAASSGGSSGGSRKAKPRGGSSGSIGSSGPSVSSTPSRSSGSRSGARTATRRGGSR